MGSGYQDPASLGRQACDGHKYKEEVTEEEQATHRGPQMPFTELMNLTSEAEPALLCLGQDPQQPVVMATRILH